MYEVFDRFLAVPTWNTNQESDRIRFYLCLDRVVADPAFSPDEMADYMREAVGVSYDDGSPMAGAISRYADAAWAVKDYLRATTSPHKALVGGQRN